MQPYAPPPPPRKNLAVPLAFTFAAGVVCTLVLVVAVVFVWNARDGLPKTTGNGQQISSAPTGNGGCEWRTVVTQSGRKATQPQAVEARVMTASIGTNLGTITISLYGDRAPCTVASFRSLSQQGYYNGVACHRVTTDATMAMVQCGDPAGDGRGGPGYEYNDENLPSGTDRPYPRGILAMANSGPNTNGSQFFILQADATALGPNYTVFGEVTNGMSIVDKVIEGGHDNSSAGGGGKPKEQLAFTTVVVP